MYEVIITTPYNVIHYYVDSINNIERIDTKCKRLER